MDKTEHELKKKTPTWFLSSVSTLLDDQIVSSHTGNSSKTETNKVKRNFKQSIKLSLQTHDVQIFKHQF